MMVVLPVISGLISIFGMANAFKYSNQPYDHSIGEVAFWYAHGAYCSADTINSWTSGMGSGQPENKEFQIYRTITTSSLQAYIWHGQRSTGKQRIPNLSNDHHLVTA